MKIDGRAIAEKILNQLKKRVAILKRRNIIPCLVVIRVGNDPATTSYIAQKEKMVNSIGGKITIYNYPNGVLEKKLLDNLQTFRKQKNIHGIIVQLPLPKHIDQEKLLLAIDPKKDIDGFHPKSDFHMPIADAVTELLEHVFINISHKQQSFVEWLKKQNIVVIGKGKTGGKPIINLLKQQNIQPFVIDSKTMHPEKWTAKADVIISAVGKGKILTRDMVKKGVVLIGIGMRKGMDNKFYGDYNENEIKDVASWYTPIPGGVGPVNAAKLMENLVTAAKCQNALP